MTRPAKRSSRPRQLPAGMQQRGNMFYCRFRAGGRLIRQPPENIARNPLEPLNEVLPIFRRCELEGTESPHCHRHEQQWAPA